MKTTAEKILALKAERASKLEKMNDLSSAVPDGELMGEAQLQESNELEGRHQGVERGDRAPRGRAGTEQVGQRPGHVARARPRARSRARRVQPHRDAEAQTTPPARGSRARRCASWPRRAAARRDHRTPRSSTPDDPASQSSSRRPSPARRPPTPSRRPRSTRRHPERVHRVSASDDDPRQVRDDRERGDVPRSDARRVLHPHRSSDGGGTGFWVGEGKPAPLTKGAFDTVTLAALKVAAISVLTKESMRFGVPSAETRSATT
jgi:hypothetical protein